MAKHIKQTIVPKNKLNIKQKYLKAILDGTKTDEIRNNSKLTGWVELKSIETNDTLIVKFGQTYYPTTDFLDDLRKQKWWDDFCEKYVNENKHFLWIYSIRQIVKSSKENGGK
ncbi:MAG: hypothetical protein LBF36_00045 [Mycoplasmataceae bacterium]|nr:hypothetical protein [Mycoplasmataceae bacterium]